MEEMRADKFMLLVMVSNCVDILFIGTTAITAIGFNDNKAEAIYWVFNIITVIAMIKLHKKTGGRRWNEFQSKDELERSITLAAAKRTLIAFQMTLVMLLIGLIMLLELGQHDKFPMVTLLAIPGVLIAMQIYYSLTWVKEYKEVL
ncbi:hypothetical protein G7081_07095 [Vagococcus coleopterorum]|uniref:Uncharacterized protein n=1 Tax=Vagococcus coleopterorum TaxID=2714946 RepID=A0A6G8API2_9ENTE|nr:hypothetical protein [Vagococcus coleopterorum]QIL46852.1 hypothetical protein G7081_07095 [Vagococcus coleopterorum]